MGQSLERRGALVPPKIDIRSSEGARGSREGAEQGEQGGRPGRESSASSYSLTSRGTEGDLNTSVAVIPPMQICPGDLLVYSRVLANKASGYGKDTYIHKLDLQAMGTRLWINCELYLTHKILTMMIPIRN